MRPRGNAIGGVKTSGVEGATVTDTEALSSSTPDGTKAWWSQQELADHLAVPIGAVRKWRHERTGPQARKFGRHVRYHIDDVKAWIKTR